MEHKFSGMLDWGMFYAANSFHDSVSNQRVVFGWILEEDLSDELREAQGWSGFISLPRSLSMQTIKGVDPRCMPVLDKVPGFEYQDDGQGTLNVSTMCCQPHPKLQLLRRRKLPSLDTLAVYPSLEAGHIHSQEFQQCELHSLELNITMSFDAHVELFGIDIFHSSVK
ncbi:hypothetical protein E4T49_08530 [Aureobasidium sp. EXF-10728]|nr:hypothetical protein E4T49_08530 [Aureobasidium sp. EXF-10728]